MRISIAEGPCRSHDSVGPHDALAQNLLADLLEYGLNPNKKVKPSEKAADEKASSGDKGKASVSSSAAKGKASRSKLVKRPGRPRRK